MALTFTERDRWHAGNQLHVVCDVTFDGAYPAGGEAITASDFGMVRITNINCNAAISADELTAVVVAHDVDGGTLVCYTSAGDGDALDEAGAADVDALVATLEVVGA